MRASTLKRFIRQPHFDEHLELHRLDCLSSHRHLDAYDFVQRTLEETPAEEIRPVRWLTGNDLQALGLSTRTSLQRNPSALEDAQLEGLINSKPEAIDYVKQHFGDSKKNLAHFREKPEISALYYPLEHHRFILFQERTAHGCYDLSLGRLRFCASGDLYLWYLFICRSHLKFHKLGPFLLRAFRLGDNMAEKKFVVPEILPILPVRDTVLFPGAVLAANRRTREFSGVS